MRFLFAVLLSIVSSAAYSAGQGVPVAPWLNQCQMPRIDYSEYNRKIPIILMNGYWKCYERNQMKMPCVTTFKAVKMADKSWQFRVLCGPMMKLEEHKAGGL